MFDTEQLKRIEDELQVTLPQVYRELLLAYPFAADPDPYSWEIFGHVNTIIGENKTYRGVGFFGQVWPSHYLAIGEDGFGNLYFLDLSRSDEVVFFADHEETSDSDQIQTYEETTNLAEWIKQMKEERAKDEAEEARAEAKRNQFRTENVP